MRRKREAVPPEAVVAAVVHEVRAESRLNNPNYRTIARMLADALEALAEHALPEYGPSPLNEALRVPGMQEALVARTAQARPQSAVNCRPADRIPGARMNKITALCDPHYILELLREVQEQIGPDPFKLTFSSGPDLPFRITLPERGLNYCGYVGVRGLELDWPETDRLKQAVLAAARKIAAYRDELL